jgi:hypothetical protein
MRATGAYDDYQLTASRSNLEKNGGVEGARRGIYGPLLHDGNNTEQKEAQQKQEKLLNKSNKNRNRRKNRRNTKKKKIDRLNRIILAGVAGDASLSSETAAGFNTYTR